MHLTKTHAKDILWHSVKATLCAVQLFLLHGVAGLGVDSLLRQLLEEKTLPYTLLHLGVDIAMFFALWWYYDHIDDYSFNRFCEAPTPPTLLRDPGFVTDRSVPAIIFRIGSIGFQIHQ